MTQCALADLSSTVVEDSEGSTSMSEGMDWALLLRCEKDLMTDQ